MNDLQSISKLVFANETGGLTLPIRRLDATTMAQVLSSHSQLRKLEELLIMNGSGNAQIAMSLLKVAHATNLSVKTTSAVSAGAFSLASVRQSQSLEQISSISIHPVGGPTTSSRASYTISQSLVFDAMAYGQFKPHINADTLRLIVAIQCALVVNAYMNEDEEGRIPVNELWYPAQALFDQCFEGKTSLPLGIVDSFGIPEIGVVKLLATLVGDDFKIADSIWRLRSFDHIRKLIDNQQKIRTND